MSVQAFVEHMLAHTASLVRGARTLPKRAGIASGVLVCADPDLLLLTAGHIFKRPGIWTLETGLTTAGSTLHLTLRDIQVLTSKDVRAGRAKTIDLAWARIRGEDARAALRALPAKSPTLQLNCYRGPLDAVPRGDTMYGFAAWNRVLFDANLRHLERQASYEVGMRFRQARPDDGIYEFSLARNHQSHAYYRGASGAPIADEEGCIVALLLGGQEAQRIVYGAPLARYEELFELRGVT